MFLLDHLQIPNTSVKVEHGHNKLLRHPCSKKERKCKEEITVNRAISTLKPGLIHSEYLASVPDYSFYYYYYLLYILLLLLLPYI